MRPYGTGSLLPELSNDDNSFTLAPVGEQIQPLCAGFSGITIYNHMVNLDSSNRYGRLVYANE